MCKSGSGLKPKLQLAHRLLAVRVFAVASIAATLQPELAEQGLVLSVAANVWKAQSWSVQDTNLTSAEESTFPARPGLSASLRVAGKGRAIPHGQAQLISKALNGSSVSLPGKCAGPRSSKALKSQISGDRWARLGLELGDMWQQGSLWAK